MATPSGSTYRVLPAPNEPDSLHLLNCAEYDVTRVRTTGYEPPLASTVTDLYPGSRIDATLSWQTDPPCFESVAVKEATLFTFARGISGLFEVALDTWEESRQHGQAMNSRVTYSNDGQPNGALYTFAEQSGERDLFAEFRSGRRPLEPLLEKIETEPPYEVFIFDPATHALILVYIVFEKDSILANTVRDTYDCPRPSQQSTDVATPTNTDDDIDLWDLDDLS